MAIKRIEIYLCDKCGNECRKEDSHRTVHYDYYRDVGHSRVNAGFGWHVPYGVSNGDLCPSCVDDAILRLAAQVTNKREHKASEMEESE